MLRFGLALSSLVLLSWLFLTSVALHSSVDLVWVAVLTLALYALAALAALWAGIGLASILRRVLRGPLERRAPAA